MTNTISPIGVFESASMAEFASQVEAGAWSETEQWFFYDALEASGIKDQEFLEALAQGNAKQLVLLAHDRRKANHLLRAKFRLGHVSLFTRREFFPRAVNKALIPPNPSFSPGQANAGLQSEVAPPGIGSQCTPDGYVYQLADMDGPSGVGSGNGGRPKVEKVVLVVDGYSSGSLLAPALHERGYKVVHLHSHGAPLQGYVKSFKPEDYDILLSHQGDLATTLEILKKLSPVAVIAGSEPGVLLADQLSQALGVRSNGVNPARRDKYLAGEVLKQAGLSHAEQFSSNDLEAILAWVGTHNRWPVVLKPLNSAGTEDVYVVSNEVEVRNAFANILGKINDTGEVNAAVLVQEYLEGVEYAVNTVSFNGRHIVTDIWRYDRHLIEGAATVYDQDWLIPFEGEAQSQLVPYVLQVLDALGIQHGPAHIETKLTPKGPMLVDFNARMCGAMFPRIVKEAIGQSQVGVSILAYLSPGESETIPPGYQLRKHAVSVFLQSDGDGKKMSHRHRAELEKLPGVVRVHFNFGEGEILPRTTNSDTTVGGVELVYEDPEVLRQTVRTIREWQERGLFEE